MQKKINMLNVPYYTQRDNKNKPFITCYNTSMAMAIDYILRKNNFNKIDIGCTIQIEDYLYKLIYSKETKRWIKENASKYGSWFLNYKPHTLAAVECYIFNKLMNRFGYEAEFKTNQTFQDYVDLIDKGLPQILHGYFKPETRVKGHVICGVGYNKENKEFLVHDPFGDATVEYKQKHQSGCFIAYKNNHWFNKRENSIWITTIKKS